MQRLLKIGLPSAVVLLLAMLVSGVLTPPRYPGLPETPLLTLFLTPIGRAALFMSGTFGVGLMLVGGLLTREPTMLRLASRASAAFSLSAAIMIVLTLANIMAVQPWQALDTTIMTSFLTQIDEGRYLMLQVLLGIVAAWVISRAQHRVEVVFSMVALGIAVLLPAFTGHSASSVSHWIASATMVLHLGGMMVWVGGVMALVPMRHDPVVITGFSSIAIAAYALLVVSGAASLYTRVVSWSDFLHDRYMWFVVAKVALAAVLGFIGYRNLRTVKAKFAGDAPELFRRTLAVEGALMLVVIALAVTLARMANP